MKNLFCLTLLLFFCSTQYAAAQDACQPRISLDGSVVGNKITPQNLALSRTLEVECISSGVQTWKVLSYDVVRVPKKADPTVTKCTGENFSAETLVQLKNAKKKDTIFFEQIKLRNESGEEVELGYMLKVN